MHTSAGTKPNRGGPAFWAAVRRAMPDHDQRRRRLAATGATLWLA